jgi:cytoskeletal protein RodZ
MGIEEQQPLSLNEEGGGWQLPSNKQLGALLRERRKESGLTYDAISERIKVSTRYLEALENENWDHLPSPTFIKGFIRSYARLLGLSEEGLIALYQETAPPPQMPKPLQAVHQKRKGILYLIWVLALLAGGVVAYEWIEHSDFTGKTTEKGHVLSSKERSNAAQIEVDRRLKKERSSPKDTQQPKSPIQTEAELPREGPTPAPGPQQTGSFVKPVNGPQQTEATVSPSPTITPSKAETRPSRTAPAAEADMPPLVLKATVRERTWVRVIMDGERKKEYTLEPENNLEWRAHKGFELMIGNAGGIDLEFNGKKVEQLGKRGQVIRLRLPSGDTRSVSPN